MGKLKRRITLEGSTNFGFERRKLKVFQLINFFNASLGVFNEDFFIGHENGESSVSQSFIFDDFPPF